MASTTTLRSYVLCCAAANKGIGFEIARLLAEAGMTVVVTSRSEQLGKAALQKLSDLQSEWSGQISVCITL
jgi:NAD(P)-dependent dehydrogenase (short-subunit alcohol dehydrogenase family)